MMNDSAQCKTRDPVHGQSINGQQLRLDVRHPDASTMEITVTNEDFPASFRQGLKHILALVGIYVPFVWVNNFQWLLVDVLFLVGGSLMLFRLAGKIRFETIMVAHPLALQKSTVYAFGRCSRLLVPIGNIHDIVINEVICSFQVIYVLNILTKGKTFERKPIIPLLLTRPRISILETIYRDLQSVLKRNPNSTRS